MGAKSASADEVEEKQENIAAEENENVVTETMKSEASQDDVVDNQNVDGPGTKEEVSTNTEEEEEQLEGIASEGDGRDVNEESSSNVREGDVSADENVDEPGTT